MSKNCWYVDFELYFNGRMYTINELTPAAKIRIYETIGHGVLKGKLKLKDFKDQRGR